MRRRFALGATIAMVALTLAACGGSSSKESKASSTTTTSASTATLLPRNTVVPVSVVTQQFSEITKEASTGPNETSIGKPIGTRSVVFTNGDGSKKVTISIDQYASASDASAAYQTAVEGSKGAPGFQPAASPKERI